ANFAGVDVQRESFGLNVEFKRDDLSSLYLLMERVAVFYVEQLKLSSKAIDYLKKRKVRGEIARDFILGYAPDKWSALTERFEQQLLIDAGLLIIKDDGRTYDRFRDRIMFPIRDKRARIIGFGGRVIDDSLPKYLNSPETTLFHKGKEVYGLYELLEKNAKPQRIIIVEGYLDVIALAQYGINYAVAALGTAASQAHLDLLFRFTSELVFCFDGDKAGREAAWRAMEPAFSSLKDGRQIRIMILPQSHDPDSLVRDEGMSGFTERILRAHPLSDYFFEHIAEGLNLSEMEGRAQLISKAKPYLEKLPDNVFREMMFDRLKKLSAMTSLDSPDNVAVSDSVNQKPFQFEPGRLSSARVAIALLLQRPSLAEIVREKEIDWDGLEFRGIQLFKNILEVIMDKKNVNTAVLIEHYRNTTEDKSVKALALLDVYVSDDKIEEVFSDALSVLLEQARDAGISRLLAKSKAQNLEIQEQELLVKMLAAK
ncbi:MAG: DNA primase, partial [Methylococcales bacterium]